MLGMIKRHLNRHKYKIVVGVPMVVLLASSLSLVRDPNELCVVPTDNRYVTVGEHVTLDVYADADTPINVIGATIRIPHDALTFESYSKEDSIVTLWAEEPNYTDDILHFSGGIVRPGGFMGTGTVLSFVVVPTKEGPVTVSFDEVEMLAHDGTGTKVDCGHTPVTLFVRNDANPSPDVNQDKHVNIFDLGLVSMNIMLGYKPLYDLNHDGVVSFADILLILSIMGDGSPTEGAVLFWNRT